MSHQGRRFDPRTDHHISFCSSATSSWYMVVMVVAGKKFARPAAEFFRVAGQNASACLYDDTLFFLKAEDVQDFAVGRHLLRCTH